MALTRVLGASSCASCRWALFRAFADVSGVQWRSNLVPSLRPATRTPRHLRFSSNIPQLGPQDQGRLHDLEESAEKKEDVSDENIGDGMQTEASQDVEASPPTELPWYLQVQTPQKETPPLSDRQRIPDLPENPPEILAPALQHISVDLGLDDLALLDLRGLDPPPALGANLLMVIGTARSEKHLHVSADRFCRWLRSEYKLRPSADGLLGRNELKLKLKRKNRRAKLMGSASSEDQDDGVRTGWVCVNIGTLETPKESTPPPKDTGFVGFGRRTEGVQLVVQMLTEEKREELDLERLWTGIKKRASLQVPGLVQDETLDIESNTETSSQTQIASEVSTSGTIRPPGSMQIRSCSSLARQSRGIHTSARLSLPEINQAGAQPGFDHDLFGQYSFDMPEIHQSKGDFDHSFTETIPHDLRVHNAAIEAVMSGDFALARTFFLDARSLPRYQNDGWRSAYLQCLMTYMQSQNPSQVISLLGENSQDRTSTQFLRSFYQTMSTFPSPEEWRYKALLFFLARKVGHPGYTSEDVRALHYEMRLSGFEISRQTYIDLLRAVLLPSPAQELEVEHEAKSDQETEGESKMKMPGMQQLNSAAAILKDMSDSGFPVVSPDVFIELQAAITDWTANNPSPPLKNEKSLNPFFSANASRDLPYIKLTPLQYRMRMLMLKMRIDFPGDARKMRLMDLFAQQGDWPSFWDVFCTGTRRGESRSAKLYAFMFNKVAETGHQRGCMHALRTWPDDMATERPRVLLMGEVLQAVKRCVKVADPECEELAENSENNSEWVKIWRRCIEAEGLIAGTISPRK